VSLHNALQGFMCLALQGSDGLRVLKDDVARAWLAAQDQLNNLRNEFIHFVPKGWSVELAGLPQICANCINVDEFLIQ